MSQQKHNKPPEAVLEIVRRANFGSVRNDWDEQRLGESRKRAIDAINDYKALKSEIENNRQARAEISEWLKQNEHEA